jgi:HAD superfamily hydrolase (TIGR01509 family)
MPLRALIFDVDGTLAETERHGHLPAFNAAFAAEGLPWRWDEALYGTMLDVTGGKERMRYYAAKYDAATAARPDFEALLARVHEAKTRHYQRLIESGAVRLRADVGSLICEARTEGLRLAIASSSTPSSVRSLLKANLGPESPDWFDVIATGDVVKAKKPAPDLYLWTLNALGLPARQCMTIEDSAHGLAASLAAGIPTVITISDYTIHETFDGARMVLPRGETLSLDQLRLWHATASPA